MKFEEKYMQRCLDLAIKGLGKVAPNPLVGAVVVLNNKIIGEGFHKKYGGAHAEVNAILSVKDKSVLKNATLYINLEPCSHHGKTPPCTDLILKYKIPQIVIGCEDPFELVKGKGIKTLQRNGCKIKTGVLLKQCKHLNRKFLTYHTKKRPYVILKWAQTADGFIQNKLLNAKNKISNKFSQQIVHKWRSEEQAVMVGTNTALTDNPQLNVRRWKGKNPVRLVIDKNLRLPDYLHLYDGSEPTIVFTSQRKKTIHNLRYVNIDFHKNILPQILIFLYGEQVQSIIVEGGKILLNSYLENNLWDEARVFISKKTFKEGIKAPEIPSMTSLIDRVASDQLALYYNYS